MVDLVGMRATALRMLEPEWEGLHEIVARWDNGDVAAWFPVHEGDAIPEWFDNGLRLTVRTEGRPVNAVASVMLQADLIRDDEQGIVLGHMLETLRADCERHIAAA
jgi:hypothetical protein